MNFNQLSQSEDKIYTPYAGKTSNGDWIEGVISINYLNEVYGEYETYQQLMENTVWEGHKKFFEHLKKETDFFN